MIEAGRVCYIYGKWKGRIISVNAKEGIARVLLFEGFPYRKEKPIYTYLFGQIKLKRR